MKQLFLLFGLSAIAYGTSAQQQDTHHTSDRYGVSVFTNNHSLHPTKRADAGMYAKLSAQFPGWYIATDRWTGGFSDLNGPAIVVSGSSLEDKARKVMNTQLAVAGIKAAEWKLAGQAVNPDGFNYLYFTQEVAGNKIAFAKMNFRFTADGRVARINMTGYGNPDVSLVPSFAVSKVLDVATSDMSDAIITDKSVEDNWEWFPIPSASGYVLHPAYKFKVEGATPQSSDVPLNMMGYVDAIDGSLLYRDNMTRSVDTFNLKVVASVFTNGITNPPTVVGLPYVNVKIGALTTLVANDTGFVSSSAFTLPSSDSVLLQGNWSKVRAAANSNKTPTFFTTTTTTGSTYSFPLDTLKSGQKHVNAYYHVNTVHNYMKKRYPTFTGLDYALITNVDVTGTCNAFYTGAGASSINFYPAGGGCVSFTQIRDVIYHEYGHGIVDHLYIALKGSGMANGGLNEGQADIWGLSITGDPILAQGSNGTPTSYIRRYDIDPKVYPKDLTGEVHANGEIIAGAWWDYKVNVGNLDSMGKLFSKTLYDVPDGPNGTEGAVFHEMLVSALINDDNDGDLKTGTPHIREILAAFAKHGIYLLEDVDLAHTELAHQPKATPIKVNAKLTVSNPDFFQGLNLVYRNSRSTGFVWDTLAMTDAGGYNFSVTIPAQDQGTIVDYYFAAVDVLNYQGVYFPYNYYPTSVMPENQVTLYYQFGVGMTSKQVVDFETPLSSDWQLGISTDNATAGTWIQAVPIGSTISGQVSQTNNDHTSGSGQCLVTGNAPSTAYGAYTASVKNGNTTVLTPLYDLSTYTNPIVEFYRWFGNDRGNYPRVNNWRAQMSTGSTVIFRDIDNTYQSDYQWRRRIFKPLEVYTGATKMQLRFLATEAPPSGATTNSLVEAAVDDLVIYEGVSSGVGITEQQKELAKIFPNPASDMLNIVLPVANYETVSISFYDISGKLVSTVPTTKGATKYAVDTKSMIAGQYFVVVAMDKTIQTHKVTIMSK